MEDTQPSTRIRNLHIPKLLTQLIAMVEALNTGLVALSTGLEALNTSPEAPHPTLVVLLILVSMVEALLITLMELVEQATLSTRLLTDSNTTTTAALVDTKVNTQLVTVTSRVVITVRGTALSMGQQVITILGTEARVEAKVSR